MYSNRNGVASGEMGDDPEFVRYSRSADSSGMVLVSRHIRLYASESCTASEVSLHQRMIQGEI